MSEYKNPNFLIIQLKLINEINVVHYNALIINLKICNNSNLRRNNLSFGQTYIITTDNTLSF